MFKEGRSSPAAADVARACLPRSDAAEAQAAGSAAERRLEKRTRGGC